MALSDDVQTRISTQRLKELTNPDADDNTTAINTTKLGKAADDVEAMFRIYVGVLYDGTDNRHVAMAVRGVEILLKKWGGHTKAKEEFDDFKAELRDLRKVTGGNRIRPKTDGVLQPSRDGGDPPRPAFDKRAFVDILPEGPAAGDQVDEQS